VDQGPTMARPAGAPSGAGGPVNRAHEDTRITLRSIYAVPDPLETDVEAARWAHQDLAGLTPAELADERDRCHLRLSVDPRPVPWLLDRLRRLNEVVSPSCRCGHGPR
jgi:broad specificity phosphatase PhoE